MVDVPLPQDAIDHVVVLILENRSFDHMLGCCQQLYPTLAGIDPTTPARTNSDGATSYPQAAGAARILPRDPRHETPDVLLQLEDHNGGFVKSFTQAFPHSTAAERAEVMKYHALDTLPALHTLARHFTLCDQWFSSVPGSTWTNRLFALSGTSLGRVQMPQGLLSLNLHWYDQATIFDRLNEQGIPWKIYFGDIPSSLLLVHQWEPHNAARYHPMTAFYEDSAGPAEAFPAFCFLEPSYFHPGATDDHPPHDVWDGEALIAHVYNALRANAALWASTLLVIFFDEHGGFYDHVEPPTALPPDHHQEEYTFTRLGVRVPALLVSPWVATGVFSDVLDHTSLLKYLIDKWRLGSLGNRTARARTFASALLAQPRDTPLTLPLPEAQPTVMQGEPERLNAHQSALVGLSHLLETMTHEDPHVIAARSRYVLSHPQSQIDVAMERVESFLAQQRVKVRVPSQ